MQALHIDHNLQAGGGGGGGSYNFKAYFSTHAPLMHVFLHACERICGLVSYRCSWALRAVPDFWTRSDKFTVFDGYNMLSGIFLCFFYREDKASVFQTTSAWRDLSCLD